MKVYVFEINIKRLTNIPQKTKLVEIVKVILWIKLAYRSHGIELNYSYELWLKVAREGKFLSYLCYLKC